MSRSSLKEASTRTPLLVGSGKFLQALKQPHVLNYIMKYSDKAITIETTPSGGWAMFEVIE
tara:strand:- start:4844 stop:5026 length:183 start_codon:yes stop_codon:yes gene_type:complete